jgi:hypothetical protein
MHLKFGMEIDHKHTYKLCMSIVCKSTVANMAKVQNFDVISKKFNIESVYK